MLKLVLQMMKISTNFALGMEANCRAVRTARVLPERENKAQKEV